MCLESDIFDRLCMAYPNDKGRMGVRTCSVRYLCLAAGLTFGGAILLCTLGFTVVLPHQATKNWPRVLCNATMANYNDSWCSCVPHKRITEDCSRTYPCLQVKVVYYLINENDTVVGNDYRFSNSAMLYRDWNDEFYGQVTVLLSYS